MSGSQKIFVAVALAGGALAGCDRIPGTNAFMERQARESLTTTLFDVDSAKFHEPLRAVHHGNDDLVCGEVNAKNKLGAFTGFRRFIVIPKTGDAFVDPQAGEGASDQERAYQGGWDAIKGACW